MRRLIAIFTSAALAAAALAAQSLDPNRPAPLVAGINASHIDAFMTPHYWTFIAGKGSAKLVFTFRAQSILGAALRTQVGFVLYDAKNPDKRFTKVLESTGQEVTDVVEGPSESEHQMVLEVLPPKSIVRAGGDYQIQAVEGIQFVGAAPVSGEDAILTRHFRTANCDNQAQCGVRFLAGGVVALPSGDRGTWRLFDPERGIYVIVIGNQRQSVRLKAGVGLIDVHDERMVLYQEVR